MARELHDGPLQSLIVPWRGLNEDATDLPPPAAGLRDAAKDTTDELRRITQTLRSPVLENLGLLPALRAATETFAARTGIRATCTASGAVVRLPPETEFAFFRIAQESLTNVERHAGARSVQVRLAFGPRRITLQIRDDGAGISTATAEADLLRAGKFGIVGMRERAALVGAAFRIQARRGGGCSVDAALPVSAGVAKTGRQAR